MGQISCGLSPVSAVENQQLKDIIGSFPKRNLRRSEYKIAVNAVIIHPDNQLSTFDNDEVVRLINRANLYFSKIGLSFYLQNGFVNHIHNSAFQDFQLSEEPLLRKSFDKSDALNIYYVKYISREDGSTLNGFSSLPTYSARSNRIMFSYLENSNEDFEILQDKTFLHELGHYFGLLHTFQDSASENIEDREVVTRDSGANCAFAGDQLCDTPADPFERLTSASAFDCTEDYPTNLKDKYGMTFKPAFDNLMSYHLKCGNVFTDQQYQRMEASLAIRLSPDAEYQITETDPNFVAVKPLHTKSVCRGEVLTVHISKSGLFKPENAFTVELSDPFGNNFKSIPAALFKDSVQVLLPESTPVGNAYRVRVSSTSPAIVGFPSENFAVKSEGNVQIESLDNAIQIGQTARLKVKLTGSGPWNFKLSSGEYFKDIITNEIQIGVKPEKTQTYSIVEASQSCQNTGIQGNATVEVVKPGIVIQDYMETVICENSVVSVPAKGLHPSRIGQYKIKLSNEDGDYLMQPSLSSTALNFKLPSEIKNGEIFKLKVIGEAIDDYSLPVVIKIVEKPKQPLVISPVQYCFNEESKPLTAEGSDLKWYTSEYDFSFSHELSPATSESGVKHYFVSQSNEFGCESDKSKIEVKVLPPVTASISGQTTIIKGDSAKLRINLTGQGPWEIVLNDGSVIQTQTPQFAYYVKPSNSTIYSIAGFTNNCGQGFFSGEALVQVLIPLANSEGHNQAIQVFPNPAFRFVKLKAAETQINKEIEIRLFDTKGKLYLNQTRLLEHQESIINLPGLQEGLYFLEIGDMRKKLYIRQ